MNKALRYWAYLQAGLFIGGALYGFVKGFRGAVEDEEEEFSVYVPYMETSAEEDAAILMGMREFFENNEVGIGYDGYTAWVVDGDS